MRIEVIGSGVIFDTRTAPANERSASALDVLSMADGTLLVSMRLGTDREGPDGHTAILASGDRGDTWELRYLGLADGGWDGRRGETRGWRLAELEPGELTATVLFVDRLDGHEPWVHPETQGLLPMTVFHLDSSDDGRTWLHRRRVDLDRWPGASPTGPVLRLAGGAVGQPFETWKEREDPAPGRPSAMLAISAGGGDWGEHVTVARHPSAALHYFDQRLTAHPTSGELVAMFWTHDPEAGLDTDVHIARGTPDGRRWSEPVGTGLRGQHCAPVVVDGSLLLAAYTHRGEPPGIRASLSADFGYTWDADADVEVWSSEAGLDEAVGEARTTADYWSDMGAWQFGHPAATLLPDGEVFVAFYGGTGDTRPARWARLAVAA